MEVLGVFIAVAFLMVGFGLGVGSACRLGRSSSDRQAEDAAQMAAMRELRR